MDRMCWRPPRRRRCLRNSEPTCLRSSCAWSAPTIACPRSSLVTSTSGRWCPCLHACRTTHTLSHNHWLSLSLSLSVSLSPSLSPPNLSDTHTNHTHGFHRCDLPAAMKALQGRISVVDPKRLRHDLAPEDTWVLLRGFDRELHRFNLAHPGPFTLCLRFYLLLIIDAYMCCGTVTRRCIVSTSLKQISSFSSLLDLTASGRAPTPTPNFPPRAAPTSRKKSMRPLLLVLVWRARLGSSLGCMSVSDVSVARDSCDPRQQSRSSNDTLLGCQHLT